jgi:DNA-binding transcriptional MocR family regulator
MGTINPDSVIEVDFASDDRPKYVVLEGALRTAIARGKLPAGTRLPPVRELAWKVGVTPGTVARVYRGLTEGGVLEAAVGRGTFVASAKPRSAPVAPGLAEPEEEGIVNLRTSQVVDVGQARRIAEVMAELGPSPEGYAAYPVRGSDESAREALSGWLADRAGLSIPPERMVLTLGAQHAMGVLFQALLRGPRPVILTEALAYPGFRHAAALARAELRGVAMDDEGPVAEELERIVLETGAQVFCTSSEAHNPTTIRTSERRRRQIVSVADRYNLEIVDDDCFLVAPEGPGYADLAPTRSWTITSLSKTISPALRFGAIGAPEGRTAEALGAAQQGFFGLPRPQLDLVEALIRSGAATEIADAVAGKGRERVGRLRAALGGFDLAARDEVPFAWLRLPRGWRASSLLRAAEAEGIRLKAADEFALVDGGAPNAVRLALNGTLSDARYDAALACLAQLLSAPPMEVDT